MRKFIITFIVGALLGIAGGFAAGIFAYPFLFLNDIVANEQVPGAASEIAAEQSVVATGTFIHANPSDPLHYGKGKVTVYQELLHLENDFEVGPGPKYHVYLVPRHQAAWVTMLFMRSSFGDTTGTVSMVLATAISSNAVNVSLVMTLLSKRILAKMIMISAFVCSSQPMMEASPGCHLRIFPAI
jgi:hypothetical protein